MPGTDDRHYCEPPRKRADVLAYSDLNWNGTEVNPLGYGPAIFDCSEDDDGRFIVGNAEYGSYVPFCPYCGAQAPIMRGDGA